MRTPEERAKAAERSRRYYARNREALLQKAREDRQANPEKFRKYDKTTRENNHDSRRAAARARYQANIEREHARDAKYRADNKERLALLRKARYAANRDAIADASRARSRAWWKKNGARIADRKRAATKAWALAHPDRVRANRLAAIAKDPAKYRARCDVSLFVRRGRERGATTGDRRSLRAYMRWARAVASAPCHWCGVKTTPKYRHIDHVIPLARGGNNVVANLCIACPPCNRKKGAKMPEDFAGQAELRFA